jgi:heme-degrading monooxygenase HmoA
MGPGRSLPAAVIVEHAVINVRPGDEDAFEAAYADAKAVLASSPGCRSIRVHRGIESPSRYLLLVEWDHLDDHVVGFRESERFTQWRALIGPFFDGAPAVDHFDPI